MSGIYNPDPPPPLWLNAPPPAPTITATQSYSYVIHTAVMDALKADAFFAGYTFGLTKMLPVQSYQIPYLGIYRIDDQELPDGDANCGDIRFNNTLRLGFSVVIANNNPAQGYQQIDAAYWRIKNVLWPSKLMNVMHSSMVDNVLIESVTRGVMRPKFGFADAKNETPIAECEYEASIFYREMWDPIITDTLDEIDVTTGIEPGDTLDEMKQRVQIADRIDFNPSHFDPANTSPNLTLSPDLLSAIRITGDQSYAMTKSTPSTAVGKVYVEACMGNDGYGIGVANAAASLASDNWPGIDTNSIGLYNTGEIDIGGVADSVVGPTFVAGDWIGLAVDLGAQSISFRNVTQNSAWSGAVGIIVLGAPPYYLFAGLNVNGDPVTANFDGAFRGAVPAGCTRWGGGDAAPPGLDDFT
jgi:hypothetical protein